MQRILVIDDDPAITSVLKRGLSYEGFSVDTANDGSTGLTRARTLPPDLVILDRMMPDLDGMEVLRHLRAAEAPFPVLLLTAKDTVEDQVAGLEQGADDYVTKPFTFALLLARIHVLLRRHSEDRPVVLRFADLRLDTGTQRAQRGYREMDLTSTEYQLLHEFLEHPERVLAKEFLLDRVWGYGFAGNDNILEVFIRQLRQKLEAGGEPRLIHTLRGSGYVLRES